MSMTANSSLASICIGTGDCAADGGGEQLGVVRIANDPLTLGLEIGKAGECPEVVLEATYGWCWAADVLAGTGARCIWRIRWESRDSPIGG